VAVARQEALIVIVELSLNLNLKAAMSRDYSVWTGVRRLDSLVSHLSLKNAMSPNNLENHMPESVRPALGKGVFLI
jgi:hypothetical protein